MAKESLYELTEQYATVRDMLFDEDVDEQGDFIVGGKNK